MGVPRVSNKWIPIVVIGICIPFSGWAESNNNSHVNPPSQSQAKRTQGTRGPPPLFPNSGGEDLYRKLSQEADPITRMAILRDAKASELADLKGLLENQESLSPVQKQALSDLEAALEARDLDPEDTFKGAANETPEEKLAREAMAERYFEELGGNEALEKAYPQLTKAELDRIPVTEKAKALYEKATSKPTESGTASKGKAASPDLRLSDFRSEKSKETALPAVPGRRTLINGESYPITQLPEGSSEGNVVKPVFDTAGKMILNKGAFSNNGGQSYTERNLPENLRVDPKTGNFFATAAPVAKPDAKPDATKSEPDAPRSASAPTESAGSSDSFEKQFAEKTDSTGYIYLQTNSSDPVLNQKLEAARLGALVGGDYVLRMPSTPETQKRIQEMGLAPYLRDIVLDPKEGAPAFQKQLEKFDTSKEVKNLFTFVPSDGKKESFSEVDYRDPKTGEWKSRMAQVGTPTPGFSPKSYGGAEDLAPVMAAGLATNFDAAAMKVEQTIQKLTGWKPNPFVTLPVAAVMEGLSSKDTTGLFGNSRLTKGASDELTRFSLTTWNRTRPSSLNAKLVLNALPHSEVLKPYVSGAQLLGRVIGENWPGMNPLSSGTPNPSAPIEAKK